MELAYLPDPIRRFNEINYSTWEEINLKDKYSRTQRHVSKETKTSEKNCSICQQKKKRILSDYIKSKQNPRNTTSIQEEDEEAEEKNGTN